MGAGIHTFVEVRRSGKWVKVNEKLFPESAERKTDRPFDWSNYGMFGFLGNVRNYSRVPVLGWLKGLPDDSAYLYQRFADDPWFLDDTHSKTYYSLRELLDFDYSESFEDQRYGGTVTIREFLGERFFSEIEILKTLGKADSVRVVIWFDN